MTQTIPRATAPILANTPTLATHNLAQYSAFNFVSDRIADNMPEAAMQWQAGYIHGLIQAFTIAGAITAEQALQLEQAQDQAVRGVA